MVASFIKLFALGATFALGCTAIALSAAILGLWVLGLARGDEETLLATLGGRDVRAP